MIIQRLRTRSRSAVRSRTGSETRELAESLVKRAQTPISVDQEMETFRAYFKESKNSDNRTATKEADLTAPEKGTINVKDFIESKGKATNYESALKPTDDKERLRKASIIAEMISNYSEKVKPNARKFDRIRTDIFDNPREPFKATNNFGEFRTSVPQTLSP